jgi:hypothetical protein
VDCLPSQLPLYLGGYRRVKAWIMPPKELSGCGFRSLLAGFTKFTSSTQTECQPYPSHRRPRRSTATIGIPHIPTPERSPPTSSHETGSTGSENGVQPDIRLTRRLAKVGEFVAVPLMDHVVIGRDAHRNPRREGVIARSQTSALAPYLLLRTWYLACRSRARNPIRFSGFSGGVANSRIA